jgi:hypothetical protein
MGVPDMKPGSAVGSPNRLRWSTPVGDWREFGGRMLPVNAKVIWHLPKGDFAYGEFEILDIAYNEPGR